MSTASDFLFNIHAVTGNFFGNQDWQWAKQQDQKFTTEMTTGSKVTDDSRIEERIRLGVGAALYAIPYLLGRMVVEGAKNTVDFAVHRTLGRSAFQKRMPNAYVLGVPVAIPFVTTLAAMETVIRLAGFNSFGKGVIALAGKRAANLSSYTRAICGIDSKSTKYLDSIHEDQKKLFGTPDGGWGITPVIDRMSIVTLPGAFAALEIGIAAAFTAVCFSVEHAFYALGFNKFGLGVIKLACKRAMNLSSYTRLIFGIKKDNAEELKLEQQALFSRPKEWNSYEVASRLSLVTIPGVIAAVAMAMAVAVTAIGFAIRILYRPLGFTAYGGHVIAAASMRAANIMQRYTRLSFNYDESIKKHQDAVFAPIKSKWDLIDRMALLTIPGAIALVEIAAASAITLALATIETSLRLLGASKRAFNGIKLVVSTCTHMLGVTASPFREIWAKKMTAPVRSYWDVMNCIGMVASGVVFGAISTAIMLPLALVGISKSNYHRLNYYRASFKNTGPEAIKKHAEKLAACEQTKLGLIFSKLNILHILSRVVYGVVRFVIAPMLYIGVKLVVNVFGLVPLIKLINNIVNPLSYDENTVEGKERQRLLKLSDALDIYGHWPEDVSTAQPRGSLSRFGAGLFSSVRQVFALGGTEEENALLDYKDDFEEFVRKEKIKNKTGVVDLSLFAPKKVNSKFESVIINKNVLSKKSQ